MRRYCFFPAKIPPPNFGYGRKKTISPRGRPNLVAKPSDSQEFLYNMVLRTWIWGSLVLVHAIWPDVKPTIRPPPISKKIQKMPPPGIGLRTTLKIVSASQTDISEAPWTKFAAVALTRRRAPRGGPRWPWGPTFPHFPPPTKSRFGPPGPTLGPRGIPIGPRRGQ